VNSPYTVELFDRELILQTPSTDIYHETYEKFSEKGFGFFRMAKVAGLAFTLAISSVTAIPDPWLVERKRRYATVTASIYRQFVGIFISRSEALRIAREILEEAERERAAIAEFEATRGIQWGDEP
jgi:hypothetical protein